VGRRFRSGSATAFKLERHRQSWLALPGSSTRLGVCQRLCPELNRGQYAQSLFSPRSGKWGADCGVNSHGRVPSVQAGHEMPLPRIELHQFPNACQFAALYLLAAPACWLGLQPAPAAQPLTVEVQAAMALASWPVRLTKYGLLAASRRCGSKGGINIPGRGHRTRRGMSPRRPFEGRAGRYRDKCLILLEATPGIEPG
jgi:hypothetical protein